MNVSMELFGLSKFWTDMITIPLFSAIAGYLTNWTGVLMLFKPLRFHGFRFPGLKILFPLLPRRIQVLPLIRYDGKIGWQGIVPSRADKMASIAVDKGLGKLGSINDFYRELEPDKIADHLVATAQGEIREIVDALMSREHPQLWHDLPPLVKEAVHARVRQQLPAIVREITEKIGENADQLIDAKLMVIGYFQRHPELLNELFLIMGRKELKFMINFGFWFGLPMGVLIAIAVHYVPEWWVILVGATIVGWMVNWVGITMIFEPIFPKKWVPWRQGLLIKRQPEITDAYSQMVADHVVTLKNIGDELLYGPRADRTRQMLEDTMRPAIDKSVGPARGAVRVAVGTREYDRIRDSVAMESMTFMDVLNDAEFGRQQSRNIYRFVRSQMIKMGPDDFVEMLRSAIKQDEWLLFVHGGVLGVGVGALHLLIFGV
ncbi:uncharacterized protein DUF445 [Herbihabitans rhizosphaerae]|uniref:Uncharacterized protein DUF445 n=1 Tax=Herbihabitans rhizosphaerae TaxID=1872711 RepID=A0A4Q7KWV8_9PSEU|nr:DUF445 family protein [Herbihabitans rhizosphaerae]RZS41086.1 uncharacterized protein DUF445 [Herbihabitans rhizosphaerae]